MSLIECPCLSQVSVANATVLRLTRELAFIDEVLAAAAAGKLRPPSTNHFVDRCNTIPLYCFHLSRAW